MKFAAVCLSDDVEDADGFLVEASLATGQFSAQASALSLGDAVSTPNVDNENGNLYTLEADTTPFSIQGTFMLSEAGSEYGAWELGVRFQDLDDAAETTVIDFGANYYANGHDYKYIINYSSVSSDNAANEVDAITVGVNARF